MLQLCIPVYNEAPTIGVLLWRIRKVFRDVPRDYEIVVYDDGSTDATAETLKPYADVLPLTILGGTQHLGYAHAVNALCRHAARNTRYARRDALILLQGDFTDQPEDIPELVKRFEGGADLVIVERDLAARAPDAVRRLSRVAPWVLKPFVTLPGISDPFGAFRLMRISTVRDVVKAAGDAPVVRGDAWEANLDLLIATLPHARRVETVRLAPRYDLRPRETRRHTWTDAIRLGRYAWHARSRARATKTAAGAA